MGCEESHGGVYKVGYVRGDRTNTSEGNGGIGEGE